jgi:hypothetical protein
MPVTRCFFCDRQYGVQVCKRCLEQHIQKTDISPLIIKARLFLTISEWYSDYEQKLQCINKAIKQIDYVLRITKQ